MLYIHFHPYQKPPPAKDKYFQNFNHDDFKNDSNFDTKASKKAMESIRNIYQVYYLERKLFF